MRDAQIQSCEVIVTLIFVIIHLVSIYIELCISIYILYIDITSSIKYKINTSDMILLYNKLLILKIYYYKNVIYIHNKS